jgi:hypothetical protein
MNKKIKVESFNMNIQFSHKNPFIYLGIQRTLVVIP